MIASDKDWCIFLLQDVHRKASYVAEMGNSNSGAGVDSGVVAFSARVGVGVGASVLKLHAELELTSEICGGVGVELWQLRVELELSLFF